MKTYAEYYEDAYGSTQIDYEQIKRFIDSCPEGDIVEIGAGSGRLVPLYTEGRNYLFVEPSSDMLQILNKKILNKRNLKVIDSFAEKLPLSSESVAGVIFAFASLGEMRPILFALYECVRVLKPGGKIYILQNNPETFQTAAVGLNRAIKNKSEASVSAETIRAPEKGPYSFDVHFRNSAT